MSITADRQCSSRLYHALSILYSIFALHNHRIQIGMIKVEREQLSSARMLFLQKFEQSYKRKREIFLVRDFSGAHQSSSSSKFVQATLRNASGVNLGGNNNKTITKCI
jgi:hypothetical protein